MIDRGKLLCCLFWVSASLTAATTTAPGPDIQLGTIATEPHGVPIFEVIEGSTAEKAGLQAGDILESWQRGDASGLFNWPHEVVRVVYEESNRGQVRVSVLRDGERHTVRLSGHSWGVWISPIMSHGDERLFARARQLAKADCHTEAADLLIDRSLELDVIGDRVTSAWFTFVAMIRMGDAGEWDRHIELREILLSKLDQLDFPFWQMWALRISGLQLGYRGDRYVDAVSALEDMLALTSTSESFVGLEMNFHLARFSRLPGKLTQAERYLATALPIAEKIGPESVFTALLLSEYGALSMATGNLVTAEEQLDQAFRIAEDYDPDSKAFARTLNLLGQLHWSKGNNLRAKSFFQRELDIREKHTRSELDHISALNGLGAVAWSSNDSDTARDYFTRAIELLEDRKDSSPLLAELFGKLGHAEKEAEQFDLAEKHYRRALDIYRQHDSGAEGLVDIYYDLGELFEDRGFSAKSLEHYQQGMRHAEALIARFEGPEDLRANFAGKVRARYADNLSLLVDMGRAEEAFGILESYHGRVFGGMLGEREIYFSPDLPENLVTRRQELVNQALAVQRELDTTENQSSRSVLIDQLRRLRTDRARLIGEMADALGIELAEVGPTPLDYSAAVSSLEDGVLLLSYLVRGEDAFVFAVSRRQALLVAELETDTDELERLVRDFRRHMTNPGSRVSEKMMRLKARKLYDLLLAPVESRFADHARLAIVPDGPLRVLPFAALRDSEDRYLVTRKPMTILGSATLYDYLERRSGRQVERGPEERRTTSSNNWYAFGDPVYEDTSEQSENTAEAAEPTVTAPAAPLTGMLRSRDFRPLIFSEEEVAMIGRLNDRAKVMTGRDASEAQVATILGNEDVSLIHFACHAFYDAENPLNSALALTASEDGENGYLHAWEIMDRYRLQAELVVLAACESGLGRDFGPEGLLGLTRAFQYAGARSVLASLWRISDASTSELMRHFYQYIHVDNSKDEALRKAQIDLIEARGGKTEFAHPFYWAGFQLHGNWQPIAQ